MYHIVKTKSKKFQIVLVGKNGEPLSTSELLNSKQAAFKNVLAQIKATVNPMVYIQDDTIKGTLVYLMWSDGSKHITNDVPLTPKYVPGKNKK